MPILVIYNPVCGNGTGKHFFERNVIPLLQKHGKFVDKVVATESTGHAGSVLVDFLESFEGDVTVVLGSGDGTLHEIINYLPSAQLKGARVGAPPSRLHFAIVPCGTANALYSSYFPPRNDIDPVAYRLQSVQAFINGSRAVPLTLAITTMSSPPSARKRPNFAVSAVVTSTALHASILHDSEGLRASMPGIERFKVAAKLNINKWYYSWVKLLPAASAGVVQVYDASAKKFVSHEESHDDDPIVDVDGPFAYFLSTVNVDRLEPTFRITPLASQIPPTEATFDIVLVRPFRDPSVAMDTPEARSAFAAKSTAILTAAYQEGSHVDLRYGLKGEIEVGGDGPIVVEYIRCGGWEWVPDDIDDSAHILCADGAIFNIEKGGRAVCSAATPADSAGFMVHV